MRVVVATVTVVVSVVVGIVAVVVVVVVVLLLLHLVLLFLALVLLVLVVVVLLLLLYFPSISLCANQMYLWNVIMQSTELRVQQFDLFICLFVLNYSKGSSNSSSAG